MEITARRKDGSTFPAEIALSRHIAAGTPVSTCIIRDLTDRKRAEDALRETEERYHNLFFVMPSGVAVYDVIHDGNDPDGKDFIFKDMNPAGEKIDHVQRSEIVGKSLYDFFPSAREMGLPDVFKRVYQTGMPEYFPVTLYADNKISLWVTNYVWRLPSGELVALFDDVTERKHAEQALRESEEKFRMIFERSPFGIAIGDLEGRVIGSNSALESMLGYPKEELLHMNFDRFRHRMISGPRGIIGELIAGKRDSYRNREAYIRKDGQSIWAPDRYGITGSKRKTGTHLDGYTPIVDRTSRKNEDSQGEELKRSLAEKEILLAEIHHRVKNNLTAFISLLSLEGSTEETPAGRELKKDLQNRARSMALIHETLYNTHQFSEVDMDAYLTPLIDQIVNSYSSPQSIRTIVEAKGVALDLARATPIGLIVNELVTNSLKHAFPHGGKECRAGQNDPCTIGVRLTKEDGSYLMSVYDNGVGLPAGFDPLTAKTLGLKLVTFLAKHQVRAKIEVKREKGTEFVLRFKE